MAYRGQHNRRSPWRDYYDDRRYEPQPSRDPYSRPPRDYPRYNDGRRYYSEDYRDRDRDERWSRSRSPRWRERESEPDRRYHPQRSSYRDEQPSSSSRYTDDHRDRTRSPPPRHREQPPPAPEPWRPAKMTTNDYRDRSRSVTPPPAPSPTPSYLSLSSSSPSHLSQPTDGRKLLVLDLNGTLVHRAARQRFKNHHDQYGKALPRLRPVHPRPYMGTFRSYLFSPETQAWLDVMIWSSAQPHSVEDMVEHAFGEDKKHLAVVWARDTLGLSEEHYHRKVQTIKDLKTPWSKLPALLKARAEAHVSSEDADALEHPPSSQPSSPPASSQTLVPDATDHTTSLSEEPQVHSALTTLLLDDSPKKAVCQPYNHVCLPEYTQDMRSKDLELVALETVRRSLAEARAAKEERESPDIDEGAEEVEIEVPENEDDANDPEASRKRRRQEKKRRKRALKRGDDASSTETPVKSERARVEGPKGFDETLLAVIGVLDAVKTQRNVAAWIRTGGLWGASSSVSLQDAVALTDAAPGNDANDTGASTPSTPKPLWFEHGRTIEYWVGRGREAVERMGIEVRHGIER